MQVQNIQTNNNTFGARFQITKNIEKLPKDTIEELVQTAKRIGNDSDSISLQIGDLHKRRVCMPGMLYDYEFTDGIRNLVFDVNINGKNKQLKTVSYANHNVIDDDSYSIKNCIRLFLYDIQKSLKN